MPFEFWFRAELTLSSLSHRLPQSRRAVRPATCRSRSRRRVTRHAFVFGDGAPARIARTGDSGSAVGDDGAFGRCELEPTANALALPAAVGRERDAPLDGDLDGAGAEVHRHGDALAAPPRPRSLRGRELGVGASPQVGELAAERDQVAREVERRAGVLSLVLHVPARVLERQPRIVPAALATPRHWRG